jgi:hypothetical protein
MINPAWVAFGTGMFLGVWFGIAIWAFVIIREYQRRRAVLKRLNAIIKGIG